MATIKYYHNLDTKTLSSALKFSQVRVDKYCKPEQFVSKFVPVVEYFSSILTTSDSEFSNSLTFKLDIELMQLKNRLSYSYMINSLVHETDVVCDFGSHHGIIGHSLAQLTKNRVYMVECSLNSWHISQQLFNDIPFDLCPNSFANVFPLYGAVSTSNGIHEFWESTSKSVSNSLTKGLVRNPQNSSIVPVYHYKDILLWSNASFLKMNIEGEDIKIIKDIIDANPRNRPPLPRIIVLEINLNEKVNDLLEKLISKFKSVYITAFPKTNEPYLFMSAVDYLKNPKIPAEHVVLSSESPEYIEACLTQGKNQFITQWNFN